MNRFPWTDEVSMHLLAYAANWPENNITKFSKAATGYLEDVFGTSPSAKAIEIHLRRWAKRMELSVQDIVNDEPSLSELPRSCLTKEQNEALDEALSTIMDKEVSSSLSDLDSQGSSEMSYVNNTTSEAATSAPVPGADGDAQQYQEREQRPRKESQEDSALQVQQHDNIGRDPEEELQQEVDRRRQAEAEVRRLQESLRLQNVNSNAQPQGHNNLILDRAQRFDELVRSARLPRQSLTEIPGTPVPQDLSRSWATLQRLLSSSFPAAVRSPLEYGGRGVSSNLVGFAQRLLGSTIRVPIQDPDWLAQAGSQYISFNVLKAYAAFNMIEMVFLPGFPAFECPTVPCTCNKDSCQCSEDTCKCFTGSCKLLHQFRQTQALISLEAVQLFDHMGYKALAEKEDFVKEHLPIKAREISAQLSNLFSKDTPEHGRVRFVDCAKHALWLKVELILSKPGYSLRWIDANERFDPDSMEAVEHSGPVDPGARVKHCLFPALVEYDVAFPPPNLPAAQLRNKQFFSKQWPANDDERVVGKAAVLIA